MSSAALSVHTATGSDFFLRRNDYVFSTGQVNYSRPVNEGTKSSKHDFLRSRWMYLFDPRLEISFMIGGEKVSPKATPPAWFVEAIEFEATNPDMAMHQIYSNFSKLIRKNKYDEVKELLKSFDDTKAGVDIGLAMLAVTRPTSAELSSERKRFIRTFKTRIARSGKNADELLAGLI